MLAKDTFNSGQALKNGLLDHSLALVRAVSRAIIVSTAGRKAVVKGILCFYYAMNALKPIAAQERERQTEIERGGGSGVNRTPDPGRDRS